MFSPSRAETYADPVCFPANPARADPGRVHCEWFGESEQYPNDRRKPDDIILVEKYYHGTADDYTEIGSVAKSVTSTLVGIALTDGTIPSLDSTLADLLPQHRSTMKASSARVTVRQLLTSTSGWNEEDQSIDLHAKNLVRRVLAAGPGAPPGSGWNFHDANAHLLTAVLAERTGMTVLDYARERLFDPLGISSRPAYEGRIVDINSPEVGAVNQFMWLRDPDGNLIGMIEFDPAP